MRRPNHIRAHPAAHAERMFESHSKLERAMSRWEGELLRVEERKKQQPVGSLDPSSPWYRGPHETKLIERGEALMASVGTRQEEGVPEDRSGLR